MSRFRFPSLFSRAQDEPPVEPLEVGPLEPAQHRCGDIDCMQCWDAGVRYADYEKVQALEDWLHG